MGLVNTLVQGYKISDSVIYIAGMSLSLGTAELSSRVLSVGSCICNMFTSDLPSIITHFANQPVGHITAARCIPNFLHTTHHPKGQVQHKRWLLQTTQDNKNKMISPKLSPVVFCV